MKRQLSEHERSVITTALTIAVDKHKADAKNMGDQARALEPPLKVAYETIADGHAQSAEEAKGVWELLIGAKTVELDAGDPDGLE